MEKSFLSISLRQFTKFPTAENDKKRHEKYFYEISKLRIDKLFVL